MDKGQVFVLGRYVDVTAPALLGRAVNLYWDFGHVHRVAAMFADSVPGWRLSLAASMLLAGALALFLVARWAFGAVLSALAQASIRRGLSALALSMLCLLYTSRCV